MSPREWGERLAAEAPPLNAEQVESAARILAGVDEYELEAAA